MNKKIFIVLLFLAAFLLMILFFRTDIGIIALKRLSTFNSYVITGENKWLFYRGDLDYAILPWTNAAEKLAQIDSIAKQNGATLIIVPVPNKIDLYPGRLDARISNGFPRLENKSGRFMLFLKNRNVAVLDLYDTYRKARDLREPLYDPDEAHVTSYGIQIAVDETIRKFFPLYVDSGTACLRPKRISFVGNLARKKDSTATDRLIDICCNACNRESAAGDTILIVGDSYCNYLEQYRGSYRALLEGCLGNHYLFQTYYKVDAGFKLSRKVVELLKKKPQHKIIIWIFTAREFYKPLIIE